MKWSYINNFRENLNYFNKLKQASIVNFCFAQINK